MRVERLELRVEVGLLVHRVGEPVQALAGPHVDALGDDYELVALGKPFESDALPGERRQVYRLAVERRLDDVVRGDVDVRGRAGLATGEARDRGRAEGRGVRYRRSQVQMDVVRRHCQEAGAFAGFVPGQVLGGHGCECVTVREGR